MQRKLQCLWLSMLAMFLTACSSVSLDKNAGTPAYSSTPSYIAPTQIEQNIFPSQTKKAFNYPVSYGTTRTPKYDSDGHVVDYTLTRDTQLHYGTVLVTIPKGHKTGSTGSWIGTLTGNDPKLKIKEILPSKNEEDFIFHVKSLLPPATDAENSYVLVFVHGYNNDFEDSAIRAAQLGVDLGVPDNNMFMFSWPSMHKIQGYSADEATIDANEIYLRQFLEAVLKIAGQRSVHIIAHSMGNRALLRVVTAMAADRHESQMPLFGQIILAAPDVDSEVFDELGKNYALVARQTTVYLSPYDFAVDISKHIHDYSRVGCGAVPQTHIKNIVSVVSTLPSMPPSHDYFAQTIPLLTDMKNLILSGHPNRKNPPWKEMDGYWRVGKPVELLRNLNCSANITYLSTLTR